MNNKEYDFDNFEMDDFDFNDPFQDPESPSNNRSVAKDFGKGAYSGFKETITDRSFQANVLRKALPEGYGAAFDVTNDVTDKGIGLYNQVTNDLRPAIVDLKRMGRRATTMLDKVLPDAVSKKLEEILKEEKTNSAEMTKDEIRNQGIASELAPIFEAQAQEKKEDQAQDMMYKVVESKRHETNTEISQGIRNELAKHNAYQDNVTMQWQRKTLELKYKHFFVAKDHYELFKLTQEETLTHFRSLVKNTGLPEAVKIQNSELAMQLTKEKLIGKAQDKFAPMAKDFLNTFGDILGKRVKEKVAEFKDAVATASFAGDMLEGVDLEEMGISKTELGAQMGSESLTRWLGEKMGKFLAPHMAKNKKIATLGNKLLNGSENYDKMLREHLESKTYTGNISSMLQETALEALRNRRESRVGYDQIANSTDHADFDNLTRKSIIEVIPGWLSKIWHSVSGTEEDSVTFDHAGNKFVQTTDLSARIEGDAVRDTELDALKDINKNLLSVVTDGSVDDIADKIEEMFLRFARTDTDFNTKKLIDGDYLDKSKLSMEEYDRFADAVHAKLELEMDGTIGDENVKGSFAQVEANRDLRRLREAMPNTYETANLYANTANREALRRSGVTVDRDGDDHVNEEYIFERYRQHGKDKAAAEKPYDPSDKEPGKPWNPPVGPDSASGAGDSISTTIEAGELIQSIDQLIESLQGRTGGELAIDYDQLEMIEGKFSSQEHASKQVDLLSEIKELLIDLPDMFAYGDNDGTPKEGKRTRAKNYLKGKYGKLKGLGKGAFNTIIKKPWDIGKKVFGNTLKPLTFAAGLARRAGGAIKDTVLGLKNIDLYSATNKINPLITKAKLEAGEYKDAITGKIITKMSQIKGPIKDLAGNYAISPEQWRDGLYSFAGKKINFKAGKDFLLGLIKKPFNLVNPFKMLGIDKAYNKAKDFFTKLPDVYVKGESEPRLRVVKMNNGAYVNSAGVTVTHKKHLTGPIYEGKSIVINAEELKNLVTIDGKKIGLPKSVIASAIGLIGKGAGLVLNGGKKAFDLVKKGAGTAADAIKGSLGWLTSKIPGFGTDGNGEKRSFGIGTGSITKRIYALLLKYFAYKGLDVKEEELAQASGGIVNGAKAAFSSATSMGSGLLDKVKDKYNAFSGKTAKDKIKSKADELRNKYDVDGKIDKAKDKAKDYRERSGVDEKYNKAKDKASELKDKASSRGKDLKEKLKQKKDALKDKAKGAKEGFAAKMNGYMDTLFGKFKKFRNKEEKDKSKKRPSFKDKLKNEASDMKDRVGSFVNIMKERKAKKEAKRKEAREDKAAKANRKGGSFSKKVLGLMSGTFGMLSKVVGGIMGIGSVLTTVLNFLTGSSVANMFLGGGKKSLTARALAMGARAIPYVATAAVAAAPAIASGVATAAAATAAAAGTVAAVVFSPVVLTVAAVGAVSYFTYSYFSELLDPLTELRMAQYGVPDLDYDLIQTIGKFEQILSKNVSISGESASISGKVPFEQIPEIFEFDIKNKQKVKMFNKWFSERFKPVFLKNMYLLKTMANSSNLMTVDKDLKEEDKIKFAKASMIRTEPSPYTVTSSPFGDSDIVMDGRMEPIEEALALVVEKHTPRDKSAEKRMINMRNGQPSKNPQKTYDLPDDGYSAKYGQAVMKDARKANDNKANMLMMQGTVAKAANDSPAEEKFDVKDGVEYFKGTDIVRKHFDNPSLQRKYDQHMRSVIEMKDNEQATLDPKDPALNPTDEQLKTMKDVPNPKATQSTAAQFADQAAERRRNSDNPAVRKAQKQADAMKARGEVAKVADPDKPASVTPIQGTSDKPMTGEEFAKQAAERRRNSDNPTLRRVQKKIDKMKARGNSGQTTSYVPSSGAPTEVNPVASISEKEINAKISSVGDADASAIYKPLRATMGEYGKMVMSVAMLVGIEPDPILGLAKLATNFNPNKRVGARSGMYLMDAATFRKLMDKHAERYSIDKPDIKNPQHATIAVAEFLKVSIARMRSILGREPTSQENLSAMMYGTEETIRLIQADDDANVSEFIKPKTTADKDRLSAKMTKKEFFSGLSSRLDEVKASTTPAVKKSSSSSYVADTANVVNMSKYQDEKSDVVDTKEQKELVERASKRAAEQRAKAQTQYAADSSQSSLQAVTELKRANSLLAESNSYHKQSVALLKDLIKQNGKVNNTAPQATVNPTGNQSASTGQQESFKKPETSAPLDTGKISMRRSI